MTLKQKFLLFAVVLLAIFFRFFSLAEMPGGLFPDEAANGLDINLMQAGQLQPFYERGNGREALFFYALWGSVEVFGKGHWQHHLVSALVGVLSVIACYAVTRRLFMVGENLSDSDAWRRATNIAILASFLMAVSTWHVVLSRTAFRAITIPLFASLTIYFLLKTYQEEGGGRKLWNAFLTGAVFALGFYTYIAYRILVPILGLLVLWPWLAVGVTDAVKRWWKHAAFFLLAFAIFIFPIAKYFYTHEGSFVGRSGQVSIFSHDLNQGDIVGVALEVARLSLTAYFTDGDLNWRHNISGLAFLSPLVSPFFGIALLAVTWLGLRYLLSPRKKAGWWKYCALAGWFWGMLLPVVTTAEGIPHGLRSVGTIPAVFIISALGLYKFGEFVWYLHKKYVEGSPYFQSEKFLVDPHGLFRNVFVRGSMRFVVVCFAFALVLQTYFAYFVYAASSAENFYSFRSDLTVVSDYLAQRCNKTGTYLVLDKFSVQTTDYETSDWHGNFSHGCNVPYLQVDPENSWQLRGLKKGDEIVFTQSSIFDIKKFKQYHPEAALRMEVRNKFGQAVMAVYKIQN